MEVFIVQQIAQRVADFCIPNVYPVQVKTQPGKMVHVFVNGFERINAQFFR